MTSSRRGDRSGRGRAGDGDDVVIGGVMEHIEEAGCIGRLLLRFRREPLAFGACANP